MITLNMARFPVGKLEDWWLKREGIEIEFFFWPETGKSTIRIGPRDISFDSEGKFCGLGMDLTWKPPSRPVRQKAQT